MKTPVKALSPTPKTLTHPVCPLTAVMNQLRMRPTPWRKLRTGLLLTKSFISFYYRIVGWWCPCLLVTRVVVQLAIESLAWTLAATGATARAPAASRVATPAGWRGRKSSSSLPTSGLMEADVAAAVAVSLDDGDSLAVCLVHAAVAPNYQPSQRKRGAR